MIPTSISSPQSALADRGLEVEVLDHAETWVKASIVTQLSEDEFYEWVETLLSSPDLIEHDGNLLSWGRADRVN
jgi:hypothetical protein